jgi:hypothetical protein
MVFVLEGYLVTANLAMTRMHNTPGLALEFMRAGIRFANTVRRRALLPAFCRRIGLTWSGWPTSFLHFWGKPMKTLLKTGFALLAAASLSACTIATKAYVDPAYHQASSRQLHSLNPPIPLKVAVQFQTNGKPTPTADAELQHQLEQALAASGAFAPSAEADPSAALINVVVNDSSNLEDAHHRGFHTGFTLGSSGSMIDDDYEFTVTYHRAAEAPFQTVYKHAIHTTFGEINGPAGGTPTTTADAFHQVVTDVVLNFVRDLQSKGLLKG